MTDFQMTEKDKNMRFFLISGIVMTLLLAVLLLVFHFTSRQPVPIVPPAAQVLSDIEAKYPLLRKFGWRANRNKNSDG